MQAEDGFAPLLRTLVDVVHARQGQSSAKGERDVVRLEKAHIYFDPNPMGKTNHILGKTRKYVLNPTPTIRNTCNTTAVAAVIL